MASSKAKDEGLSPYIASTGRRAELYPAIDLLGGQAVRLAGGDYSKVTVYDDDPVARAAMFAEAGARCLHVVDLDAARGLGADNREAIAGIVALGRLQVQVGGGIRGLQAVEALLEAGAARVVIGTSMITDRPFVDKLAALYAESICAAIDGRDGKVAISGWQQTSHVDVLDLALELVALGFRHFLYTDIKRDGLQTGIDVLAYQGLSEAIGCPLIVSGGIASLDDLYAVRSLGDKAEAVVVGRALYEQNFTVQEALGVLGES
ncbi:MAG: 1-(5-phosphoribosyl)-5-[(5-phosphoribosylamino)methylideneamino]imidazole-4-carboxamide isomerase [Coriobacteriia bacterium]|nr:1-(5-phosphoribosyl)-5-[(5-phosphoribosylamino)methylideneamino]imidazole-4-carboxamide isomerase [Coriobacteriia bacterium]